MSVLVVPLSLEARLAVGDRGLTTVSMGASERERDVSKSARSGIERGEGYRVGGVSLPTDKFLSLTQLVPWKVSR